VTERVRAFVALLLNEEVRTLVAREIARLRPLGRSVSWVVPQNLHLTLKFLGGRNPEELDLVRQGLAEAVEGVAPFTLSFHGLGAFPGLARPRVFWVGVIAGAEHAKMLHSQVETALARCAIPPDERPFSPHLTIGRARMPSGLGALQQAITGEGQKEFGSLSVNALSLMRSDLSPAGARYTELAAFPFSPA
jgi:2'-5' RNA ligase